MRFLGFVDDMDSLLAAADCVCLPSLSEAMPFAALEAAAAARPLVASRVGGLPALVVDEQTGLLVPPAQPAALAAALRRLALDRDEGRRLGLAAHRRAQNRHSCETMLAQSLEVYRRALR